MGIFRLYSNLCLYIVKDSKMIFLESFFDKRFNFTRCYLIISSKTTYRWSAFKSEIISTGHF